jgi:SEC-C motif-containing protein
MAINVCVAALRVDSARPPLGRLPVPPTAPIARCHCGNLRAYDDCCGRFHRGEQPDAAAQLMRARYSAFVLMLEGYLLQTWHPSTRPPDLCLADSIGTRWLGLDMKAQAQGGDRAQVEFTARYRLGGGPAQQQNEISRFVREDGIWYYLDGEFPERKPVLRALRRA